MKPLCTHQLGNFGEILKLLGASFPCEVGLSVLEHSVSPKLSTCKRGNLQGMEVHCGHRGGAWQAHSPDAPPDRALVRASAASSHGGILSLIHI